MFAEVDQVVSDWDRKWREELKQQRKKKKKLKAEESDNEADDGSIRRKRLKREMRSRAFDDWDGTDDQCKNEPDVPQDPPNPLQAAYDEKAFPEKRRGRDAGPSSWVWDHDKFRERSLSPIRQPSETQAEYDTRRGAWRARAGGVYLPPEDEEEEEAPSPPSGTRRRYWEAEQ